MRARSKSKNRRDLEVLLTTKKPGGDAIFLDKIFGVGSSLDDVLTSNMVMDPKSGRTPFVYRLLSFETATTTLSPLSIRST
jgi:hypothetical protein